MKFRMGWFPSRAPKACEIAVLNDDDILDAIYAPYAHHRAMHSLTCSWIDGVLIPIEETTSGKENLQECP